MLLAETSVTSTAVATSGPLSAHLADLPRQACKSRRAPAKSRGLQSRTSAAPPAGERRRPSAKIDVGLYRFRADHDRRRAQPRIMGP